MEYPERFVELTGDEVSKLRKSLFYSTFYTLATMVIGLVLCGILYLQFGNLLCTIVLIIIAAALTLTYLAKIVAMTKSVLADTGGRQKKIIVGKVEKLREDVTETKHGRGMTRMLFGFRMTTSTSIDSNYLVKIENGEEYQVEMELYYALREGDLVEISFAPNTGYVFRVAKITP
ncbi:MAG TPA: hypothetical protein VGC76_06985 [Pyrinomonadaceae bacterium]|jgi:cytochrome c biogenesis protein CcdA